MSTSRRPDVVRVFKDSDHEWVPYEGPEGHGWQRASDGHVRYVSKGSWVPYSGPRGGQGWQSTEDEDDVRYVQDPPGEIAEGWEHVADEWPVAENPKPGESEPEPDTSDEDTVRYPQVQEYTEQAEETITDMREQATDDEDFVQTIQEEVTNKRLDVPTNDFNEENMTPMQATALGEALEILGQADQDRMDDMAEHMTDVASFQLEDGLRATDYGLSSAHAQWNSQHHFIDIFTQSFEEVSDEDAKMFVAREDHTETDIILHEFGHAFHDLNEDDLPYDDTADSSRDIPEAKIAREISKGAAHNALEFVAEAFLFQSLGATLSDELDELYDELHGPEPMPIAEQ